MLSCLTFKDEMIEFSISEVTEKSMVNISIEDTKDYPQSEYIQISLALDQLVLLNNWVNNQIKILNTID